MKYFSFVLLLAFITFGCSKKPAADSAAASGKAGTTIDTSAIKTSPVSNPNEKFVFRYKFEKGKHYEYRMASFSEDDQQIHSDSSFSQKIKQSVIYQMDVSLVNTEKDSVMEMACEVKSITLNADLNGQMLFYQSGVTNDSATLARFAQYASLISNPFNVRINDNGGVIEISKVYGIVNKYLEMTGNGGAASPQERDNLHRSIMEGALRPLVIQLFREMTDGVVARDSSWTYPQSPTPFLIFKLENTNLYKISSLEMYNNDKVAIIDAGLKTVVTGNNHYEEGGASFDFKKPETSASGQIYFNLTKGCVQKSNVKTHVTISYKMEAPSPKGGKQKGSKVENITSTNILELVN